MEMNNSDFDKKINKILQGCRLAFEKLLAQEKLLDGELVFAEKDGSIIRVKAREFEAYKENKKRDSRHEI